MYHLNPSSLAPWIGILQGLLTPVIGLTTLYIAWQQWRGNRFKLTLERYDRRLRIYLEVADELRRICDDFNPETSELLKFRRATTEADFLFGPEISKYLDEILSRGLKLRKASKEYRDLTQSIPSGYDPQKVNADMDEQEKWFIEQANTMAKEKFRKYLDISW
jgi:hypothetical protein